MKKCITLLLVATLMLSGCSVAKPVLSGTEPAAPVLQAEAPTVPQIPKKETIPTKTEPTVTIPAETVPEVTVPVETEPVSEENIPAETEPVPGVKIPAKTEPKPQQGPVQTGNAIPPATEPQEEAPVPTVSPTEPPVETDPPAIQPTIPDPPAQDSVTGGHPSSNPSDDYPPASENSVLMFVRNAKTVFLGEPDKLDVFYNGNKPLSWYSSSPYGIRVDANGQVTAHIEGCYEIYVTDGEYTAKAEILAVYGWGMASGIYFDEQELTLTVGQSQLLNVNGVAPDDRLSFRSSDPSVAEMDGYYITAVAPGTTIINVREYYGESANLRVTVIPSPEIVEVNILQESLSLYVGESVQLNWAYNGTGTLQWELHGLAAHVDENGFVTTNRAGTCTIYLTDGTYADKCDLTVSVDPSIKAEEVIFRNLNTPIYDGVVKYKGDSAKFKVDVRPYTAEQGVRVTTSDPSVASVELVYDCGTMVYELTYKKAGTCQLRLYSYDGAVKDSYTIHVKDTYDCDPGKSQLTPEEFAYLATQVGVEHGQQQSSVLSGYLYVYLSDEEVTWESARDLGEAYAHHWFEIGIDNILVTYAGWDEELGKHLFFAGY